MSRREGRDSDSKRHRFKFDRESSPKRSRRDGKPETERIPSSLNTTNGDHVDRDQKHRRRLQDALPLEAPLASDSKEETEAVGKESDKKTSGPRDRTKPSSDIPRHRSFFQHDERDGSRQAGRRFSHRANTERGWWGDSKDHHGDRDPKDQHGDRDSKDQHREKATNKTVTDDTQKRDEKSEAQGSDKNRVWRHDGFFEMESNPHPPARKRPAFREKKIPVDHEIADKAATEAVKPSHPDRSMLSERGGRNPRHLGRPEKPFSGDGALPYRGEAQRSGGPAPRYGSGRGGGNFRERDRFGGRQGQRSGDVRVEKWKHDLFDEANRSPVRKKEEEQIAKVEALLAS